MENPALSSAELVALKVFDTFYNILYNAGDAKFARAV
jgi:hypothetical protein